MLADALSIIFLNLIFLGFLAIAFHLRNLTVVIYLTFVFLANGLGTALFYYNKWQFYTRPGTFTIREFPFLMSELLALYSLPILFVSLMLLTLWVTKSRQTNLPIFETLKLPKLNLKFGSNGKIEYGFFLFFIFFMVINFFMFQNSIGIVGLVPKALPFKMTGVLYYTRYLLPTVGIFIFGLFLRKNKSFWILSLILIFISGLAAASRSIPIMGLGILPIFSVLDRRLFRTFVLSLSIVFMFQFITYSRDHTYKYRNSINRFLVDNVITSASYFTLTDSVYHVGLGLFNFTYRLGGPHDLVLSDQAQFNPKEALELIRGVYQGLGLSGNSIISRLYGMGFSKDFAFGTTLSPLAMINISRQHSVGLCFTFIFLIVLILISADMVINRIFIDVGSRRFFGLLPRFFVVYFFMSLEFKKIYAILFICTLLYIVLRYFRSIKKTMLPTASIKQ